MVNKTPKTKNGKLEKVNATNITDKDLVILDKGLILLKISKRTKNSVEKQAQLSMNSLHTRIK